MVWGRREKRRKGGQSGSGAGKEGKKKREFGRLGGQKGEGSGTEDRSESVSTERNRKKNKETA